MAKNEFFVNSAESSRLIYDFVLKSMKEAGVENALFPRRSFLCGVVPPTEILPPSWPAGTAQMRSAGFFPYRRMCSAFSSPSLCAGRALSSLCRILRGGARAAHLVLCAHFLAEGRQPGARKTGSIFRTGTAFSARSGCSKAASARERSMLSSAARAAGRSCASRAAKERSASPARAAGTPLKRRPEEKAPPSVKI